MATALKKTVPLAALVSLTCVLGCRGDGGGTEDDPCDGVSCSDHGRCEADGDEATCICDTGFVAAGTECIEEADLGALEVSYSIGVGDDFCTDAAVESIRVVVSRDATGDLADETAPCDAGAPSMTIEQLAAGSCDVQVEGSSASGAVTHEGQTSAVVRAGETTEVDVRLALIGPSVVIEPEFSGGGSCVDNEVAEIRVVLYQDSASRTYDETSDCSTATAEALRLDGLFPASVYDLRVRGIDGAGEATHAFDMDGIEPAEAGATEVTVVLEPCDGVCSEP